MMLRKAMAAAIASLRQNERLTLRDLGKRSGIAHTSIWALERGESWPTPETIAALCAAARVDVHEFLDTVMDEWSLSFGEDEV